MADNEEEQVAKMFNAGYLLQLHDPDLLKKMVTDQNKANPNIQAMAQGQQQQKRDKIMAEQKRQAERQHQQTKKPKR